MGYPWTQGDELLANDLNAAIANSIGLSSGTLPVNGSLPMTGPLTLAGNATLPLHAAPLQQINSAVAAAMAGSPFLSLATGGTVTGPLNYTATGGTTSRSAQDRATATLAVEDFGAKGDAVTDDTAAFSAAMASGLSFRLSEKTYLVNGTLAPTAATLFMLGTPGRSKIIRTTALPTGNWITFGSPSTRIDGIIFDAGGFVAASAFLTTAAVLTFTAKDCGFAHGDALTIGGSTTPGQRIEIIRCECYGMSFHGLYIQKAKNALVTGCRLHDNANNGLLVYHQNDGDPTAAQLVITDNWAWNNAKGLWAGNFTVGVSTPPVPGETDPVAIRVTIANNHAWNNTAYGIVAQADYMLVDANQCYNNGTVANLGAQILFNARYSRASNNLCNGNNTAYYGMDAGGAVGCSVDGNDFGFASVGLNFGAAIHCAARNNRFHDLISDNISIPCVDGSGGGLAFPYCASDILIRGNTFDISTIATASFKYGVHAWDGAQSIRVLDNDFYSSSAVTATFAARGLTDTFYVSGNRFNGASLVLTRAMGASITLTVPTICDVVMITDAANIHSIASDEQAFFPSGQVLWLIPGAAGSGYTSTPTVTISGDGTGATATASVNNGVVVGYKMVGLGSGYTTATVAVSGGGGSGATATAQVGMPVHAESRLSIFWQAGGTLFNGVPPWPPIHLPGGAPSITIPVGTIMDLHYVGGAWQVAGSPPSLNPVSGDLTMASGNFWGAGGIAVPGESFQNYLMTAMRLILPINREVNWNIYRDSTAAQKYSATGYAGSVQVASSNGAMNFAVYVSGTGGTAVTTGKAMSFSQAGALQIPGAIGMNGTVPPASKPTLSGAWAGNTAGKALSTLLATYGLLTDSTTA